MNRFWPSLLAEQMKVENAVVAAPLPMKLRGTIAVAERSQWERNGSAGNSFCGDQRAASEGRSPSSFGPKKWIAAWLAWRIVPPVSTTKAGQAAWSKTNALSSFILSGGRSNNVSLHQ